MTTLVNKGTLVPTKLGNSSQFITVFNAGASICEYFIQNTLPAINDLGIPIKLGDTMYCKTNVTDSFYLKSNGKTVLLITGE